MRGKVKSWVDDRGFGFIVPEGGGAEVFVHISEIKKLGLDNLVPGEHVEFLEEINPRNGRSCAVDVRVLA